MRKLLALVVTAVILAAVAFFTGVPSAAGRTSVRLTPGYLLTVNTSGFFVHVYNPTGSTLHLKGHLANPSGFSDPQDETGTVLKGQATAPIFWTCSVSVCDGTPVITVSSSKAVVSIAYEDGSSAGVIVHANEMKRL